MEKSPIDRYIPNRTHLRQFAYVSTIMIHGVNAFVMLSRFRGDIMENPKIQTYHAFQNRYISCWTFVIQMIHAALGLSCDIMDSDGKKASSTLKVLEISRDVLFDSLVVPYSFMVPTVFWSLFLYDRNLILPICLTPIVCPVANHIMHTLVPIIAVFQMTLRTSSVPRTHGRNLATLTCFTAMYLSVLAYSFSERGVWPYPVLTTLYGTVYFQIFIAMVVASLPFFYFMQWHAIRWWNREDICQKLE